MKCLQCGVCCKLFYINLTEEEYKSGDYRTQFDEFDLVEDFVEAAEVFEIAQAVKVRSKDLGSRQTSFFGKF